MADERSTGFFLDVQKWRGSRSVQRMSMAERGVYFEMMLEQWDKRFLPDDAQAVANQIASTPSQVEEVLAAWPVVRAKFVTATKGQSRIYNVSLERTRRIQALHRRARQVSGKHGGNRAAANRRQKQELQPRSAIGVLRAPIAKSSDLTRQDVTRQDQTREREIVSFSPAAPSDPKRDPFTDPIVTERAGRFIDRYELLYPRHRSGARYAVKPARDYAAAVTLCQTWADDGRLDKLAIVFLTTDHKFAEEGSRTIPQFLALASWCDAKLAAWEKNQKAAS